MSIGTYLSLEVRDNHSDDFLSYQYCQVIGGTDLASLSRPCHIIVSTCMRDYFNIQHVNVLLDIGAYLSLEVRDDHWDIFLSYPYCLVISGTDLTSLSRPCIIK